MTVSSIQQFQATEKGGPFTVVSAPAPKPGPNEVCIRPRTVAINQIDWKNHRFGALVQSWPAVLGIEGAGLVESVGYAVTAFKPGDEVMSWVQRTQFNGAFSQAYTAHETVVAKKPAGLSFEEAVSLPIAYLTAAAAVAVGLKVALPGLPKTETNTSSPPPGSVLVLGGSSAVGSTAVQLLRIALPPSTVIITTSSVAHHAHLKSLGATICLERSAQEDAVTLQASTPGGKGVDAIIDAVGAGSQSPAVYEALRSDGPKLYSQVVTGIGAKLPPGLQASLIGGQSIVDLEPNVMELLTKLLEDGQLKLPVKVEVVGSGLEAVGANLDRVMKTSGTKLVVKL